MKINWDTKPEDLTEDQKKIWENYQAEGHGYLTFLNDYMIWQILRERSASEHASTDREAEGT